MSAPTETLRAPADDGGRARLPDRSGSPSPTTASGWPSTSTASGDPTIVLLPSAPIVHARQWKAQIPYLSRHYRVIAYDGRGNGRSDRPTDPAAYHDDRMTRDIAAVMDATDTPPARARRAVLRRGLASGPARGRGARAGRGHRRLRRRRPAPHAAASVVGERRSRPSCRPTRAGPRSTGTPGGATTPTRSQFFFEQISSEPHSTKLIEDAVAWALDGDRSRR